MGCASPDCPLVVGVGNRYRRDDGLGPAVARRLQDAGYALAVVEASGEGAGLLQIMERSPWVILVDAVSSGAEPGTIHRLDAATPLPKRLFRYSTHAFGVAEAVELARALGSLPARLVIFGVEGAEFGAGDGLSSAVEQAAERVAALILAEARRSDPERS